MGERAKGYAHDLRFENGALASELIRRNSVLKVRFGLASVAAGAFLCDFLGHPRRSP
jgi:hypothetical protein